MAKRSPVQSESEASNADKGTRKYRLSNLRMRAFVQRC